MAIIKASWTSATRATGRETEGEADGLLISGVTWGGYRCIGLGGQYNFLQLQTFLWVDYRANAAPFRPLISPIPAPSPLTDPTDAP